MSETQANMEQNVQQEQNVQPQDEEAVKMQQAEERQQRIQRRQEALKKYDGEQVITGYYADYRTHDPKNTLKENAEITWVAYRFNQETGELWVGHSNWRPNQGHKYLSKSQIKEIIQNDENSQNSHFETAKSRLEKYKNEMKFYILKECICFSFIIYR